MIVVVAPGQGSQTPGFLAPWLEDAAVRDRVGQWSDAIGVDLAEHGTNSDADTIKDTALAQPLIVAAGLVTADALLADDRRALVGGVAGHSVGEFTAAAVAGVLTPTDAVSLVAERGRAMADAAALEPTSMAAVLGGDADELAALLDSLGLTAANHNGGGQTVVAGPADAIARLAEQPPAKARVVPLAVAGAFHTRFMAPAVDRVAPVAAAATVQDPTLPLWTNADGSQVRDGRRFVDLMVRQIANPVHWDAVMTSFQQAGVTGIIELAPAGALVGLAKRGLRGTPTVAIKTPDDLPAAVELLQSAADESTEAAQSTEAAR
ncbi:ACP S-malonyltransferase [Curtobacterium sp. MCPF17_050]|uniref:ACP S-malonyltransferase n=1 Tax=unclassified Curtobacterium TaxID=257496 RepID=UPI000D862B27|nr:MULTISPECIES: ACP S-malonyltransferase [unclassified Curtobacterium]PYY50814.1 ACP S-malonyltransferase [Curtobacterium sp. MCBD17_023]PZE92516.1 ACP S-malonyltransferase [Curtobacterium sp. MCBD17_008]WIB16825.1 ACP S-malonyltransferase [Curtobacterium sp. MCPF17_050]